MKNYYILLIIVSTFLYSCREGTDSGVTGSISSNLSKMDRVAIQEGPDFTVDSCIAKIEYIKLGNTGDVLIGQITHLLFTPDHIVVGDTRNANAVFVFDRNGNTQTVINRLGRGPQEYQSIRDVFLTPDKKMIGIADRAAKQVLYFDMDGNFKWKTSLPFLFDKIEWLDNETMILVSDGIHINNTPVFESYSNKDDLLFFTDTTAQNIHNSAFVNPFDVDIFHFQPLDVKRFDDHIYACKAFGDTIYQVTKESIFPRYWIDMKGINGKANFGKDITADKLYESPNYTNFPNVYTESDDYAFFTLTKENKMFPVLFNKHTKNTYNIRTDGARSALGIHLLFTKFALDNRLVAIVPAFQLLAFCPDDVPDVELRNEIKEGLSDEDNPVLLFYTLKDPDAPAAK